MNPNLPYGQQMGLPIHSGPRRQDGNYNHMAPHMRPHPGYQPYFAPQMGPVMSPYPPQYTQNWYPYQPHMMQQPYPPQTTRHPQYHPQGPHIPQQAHYPAPPASPRPHGQPSPRPFHGPPPSISRQTSNVATPASTAPTHVSSSPQPSMTSTAVSQSEESTRVASPSVTSAQFSIPDSMNAPVSFHPPLPWLSVDDESFPNRAPRRKRKIARSALATEPVEFPLEETALGKEEFVVEKELSEQLELEVGPEELQAEPTPTPTPTPLTSDTPSDGASTQPTTPSSAVPPPSTRSQHTPTQTKAVRPVIPIIPAVPILPQSPSAARRSQRDSVISTTSKNSEGPQIIVEARKESLPSISQVEPQISDENLLPASAPAPLKSWADLVRAKAAPAMQVPSPPAPMLNGSKVSKTESLSDVLNEMSSAPAEASTRIAFLQPRGLVNTGNMCYMNSVLQILVFCIPFYDLLDRVARKAAHTFNSHTPLIDAMIMFMHEYPIIDSAATVEQLRLRLKPDDFERYGDAFIPEYVYSVIRQLPRFRDMRRGHQQDAQEFLGFLLEELHEECALAMKSGSLGDSGKSTPAGGMSEPADNDSEWMEVGQKQRPAVTRSSGAILMESPVTNIFGGKLRSELKVAGNKLSVTLEPYQPLQLDIGSPHVHNIVDALKGLTRPESMQGDFDSPRGPKATATKQVFIETLPPVLILHLKRFHYDSSTKRAEKIWKKIGYPLELEVPKEVFPTQVRNRLAVHGGLPRYRLTGVIYHHGKNANGGHYTVDIRREDGQEWIRLDDTLIRRIRHEDVAEGGSEEDPKVLAAALERHKQSKSGTNRFEQFDQDDEDEEAEPEKVWSQVNGHSRSKSTMSNALNGAGTPAKESSGRQTPSQKNIIKDSKVAYLLFYQRIST